VFGFVKLVAPQGVPERSEGASAGIWGAGERGGQPLYPLLISVEARLIFDSQGLILPATLSDEVASVRQNGKLDSPGEPCQHQLIPIWDFLTANCDVCHQ
jgi:hypothetical protein